MNLQKLTFLLAASALLVSARTKPDDWRPMFDGTSLEGWKANEHPESWTVKNGAITGDGPASHLFWMKEKCANCEFKAEVRQRWRRLRACIVDRFWAWISKRVRSAGR